MDYSTLPIALIYQQKTLDKISELHELNRIVLHNFLDIETLNDVDFENFALPCFNNAYYICTMMRMERNAEYRRKSYKKIALNGNDKNTLAQCVTLSLVALLNEHCSLAWREKLQNVSNDLKHYAKSLWLERQSETLFPFSSPDDKPIYNNELVHLIGLPDAISRGIDENIVLPDELFIPRRIDERTLRDMDRENHHFEWANWTKYYDEDIVRELVEGLGATQQDKAMLIRSLMEKSDSFYVNDYPKQHVVPLLKSLAEEFCPDCLQMTNLYLDESTGATTTDTPIHSPQDHATAMPVKDSEQQGIIEQQATRIKELEEDVKSLNAKIGQLNNNSSSNIEEMLVELLTPLFYNIEKDAREFLKKVSGMDDISIIDLVLKFLNERKISPSSKGRKLWLILHAAKIYSATESNWNTALRVKQ